MITLRDVILRVANYFYTADPNCMPEDPDFADELQVSKNKICIKIWFPI